MLSRDGWSSNWPSHSDRERKWATRWVDGDCRTARNSTTHSKHSWCTHKIRDATTKLSLAQSRMARSIHVIHTEWREMQDQCPGCPNAATMVVLRHRLPGWLHPTMFLARSTDVATRHFPVASVHAQLPQQDVDAIFRFLVASAPARWPMRQGSSPRRSRVWEKSWLPLRFTQTNKTQAKGESHPLQITHITHGFPDSVK